MLAKILSVIWYYENNVTDSQHVSSNFNLKIALIIWRPSCKSMLSIML